MSQYKVVHQSDCPPEASLQGGPLFGGSYSNLESQLLASSWEKYPIQRDFSTLFCQEILHRGHYRILNLRWRPWKKGIIGDGLGRKVMLGFSMYIHTCSTYLGVVTDICMFEKSIGRSLRQKIPPCLNGRIVIFRKLIVVFNDALRSLGAFSVFRLSERDGKTNTSAFVYIRPRNVAVLSNQNAQCDERSRRPCLFTKNLVFTYWASHSKMRYFQNL